MLGEMVASLPPPDDVTKRSAIAWHGVCMAWCTSVALWLH
jgi:hypothetical protein